MTDPVNLITFGQKLQVHPTMSYVEARLGLEAHDVLYAIAFDVRGKLPIPSVGSYESEAESLRVFEITDKEIFDSVMALRRTYRIKWYVMSPRDRLRQLNIQEWHWERSTASNQQAARDQLHAIRREKRIQTRRLNGKPDYPWWHWKRWLR